MVKFSSQLRVLLDDTVINEHGSPFNCSPTFLAATSFLWDGVVVVCVGAGVVVFTPRDRWIGRGRGGELVRVGVVLTDDAKEGATPNKRKVMPG